MGKILPFHRRRWTRARDYGHRPRKLYFWPEDDPRHLTARGVARETALWLGRLRAFILGAIALSFWPAVDPALVGPPSFLGTKPERVSEVFTWCGRGRGHACVVDGDTFKLGNRRIRVIGIDAPETHSARCREEAQRGERATLRLQALLNEGPFEMTGWWHNRRDRYGRELMSVTRKRPDGSNQSIAAAMRDSGMARYYTGGLRGGWC